MPEQLLDYRDFAQISAMDRGYACERTGLQEYYAYEPEMQSFAKVFQDKARDETNRDLLVEVLQDQYQQHGFLDDFTSSKIQALKESNCFTVTTAHQPSLVTGPLYYVYKAFSAIVLASRIMERYSEYVIQPLFVIGGEDHDFDEINHCHWNGRIEWQRPAQGAVGRLDLTGLEAVLDELEEREVKHSQAKAFIQTLKRLCQKSATYGDFAQSLTIELLGQYGILVLSMDDPRFKREMIGSFKEEIFSQPSLALVQSTQQALIDSGFSNQAFPRGINLFYLTDTMRERIEKVDDRFVVLNTELSFSEEEMTHELENHPERFSPNVIFRPIFQETILPNLAYIGGGGELAYWLERKSQFAHFGLNFPMLVRRDSAIWLSRRAQRQMEKLDVSLPELAQREETLVNSFVLKWATAEFSIEDEANALKNVFDTVSTKALLVDPGLKPMVEAQKAYHLKRLAHLGAKLRKAEKTKHRTRLDALVALREEVFPGGNLQERYLNFLSIYSEEGNAFFDQLLEIFDPLDTRIKVLLQG